MSILIGLACVSPPFLFLGLLIFRQWKESQIDGEAIEYRIGGDWGDSIQWFPSDQWNDSVVKKLYSVVGWKDQKPKPKDILIGEFQRSWITFEFVSVEYKINPPDMFFAKVRPIKQEMKAALETTEQGDK